LTVQLNDIIPLYYYKDIEMKICRSVDELQSWRKEQTKSVGFVPTMGALHRGHLSLMEHAKQTDELLVVSIFVNPTQFLEGEDFEQYPKKEESDFAICERIGVDCLFLPSKDMMYEKDELSIVGPKVRAYTLEGSSRPGHFDGVLQVVLKLFNLVQPTHAFFGKKDAQQLSMIMHMVNRLFLPLEVVPVETVREEDGLALSSRNVYLSKQEREDALRLSKSLRRASSMILSHEYDVATITAEMQTFFKDVKGVSVEYIAIVDRSFQAIDRVDLGNTIIALAVKVGTTRLIDNLWI
jgi:pantoate--beta-alanine ligase